MTGHMPGHVRSLWSGSGGQSQGCGSGHMLLSHVVPSQVHESGGRLGNWSGDVSWAIAIRWKNGVQMLQLVSVMILGPTTNFLLFSAIYSALLVTCSPLVPLRAAWTATESPDKSPDGSPDHSAVRYHMPSLRSPQHSAASLFNPLWIASSLPRHDGPPAHDGAILRTANSWWTLLYVTVLFCDSCDPLLFTCI